MLRKGFKFGAAVAAGVMAFGLFIFGGDVISYVSTSTGSVRSVVKDTVPIEFELQRARDMIERIVPELQANVRLIAQEEVEIAALEKEIDTTQENLASQRHQVSELRSHLATHNVSYSASGIEFSRPQLTERLARRFARYKETKLTLSGKERLLEARRKSLAAAENMLDRSRQQKAELEQKIEGLVAQHRLIQASSTATEMYIDDRQLTKADRLLSDIQKRLDVAQRVLARETDLLDIESIGPGVDETDLLTEIDEHLERFAPSQAIANADDVNDGDRVANRDPR